VSIIAYHPGASAEEVERQVAIPLEVNFAGMPGLASLRSKSLFGACWLHACFGPGAAYDAARQEVINHLSLPTLALPRGVSPQIVPGVGLASLRYVISGPRDAQGRPVYTPQDLRSLQDWVLERQFHRVPGAVEVSSSGGLIKRYEIQPDPVRLRRYGITLAQLQNALTKSNANVGGDFQTQGRTTAVVRLVGVIGGGKDPMDRAVGMKTPEEAAAYLRLEEQKRFQEIRAIVIVAINGKPIRIDDIVVGGPLPYRGAPSKESVVIGSLPRAETVCREGPAAFEDEDAVEGAVLLREKDPEILRRVQARIRELNTTSGMLLPGLRLQPHFTSLEDGVTTLWIYGTLPIEVAQQEAANLARKVRKLLHELPGVDHIVSVAGAADGSGGQPFNSVRVCVRLKAATGEPGAGARSRQKLIADIKERLARKVPGVDWLTTTSDPLALERTFASTPAEHLLLIIGPDLEELERLSGRIRKVLEAVRGIDSVGVFHTVGKVKLEFMVDKDKCKRWGVPVADVNNLINSVLHSAALTQIYEGEKVFDVTLRWPLDRRQDQSSILDIPVDIINNTLTPGSIPSVPQTTVPSPTGTANPNPATIGSGLAPFNTFTPRLRLRDLVSPVDQYGRPHPKGEFARPGAAVIYRRDGKRLLPIRFSVAGRPLGDVQAEAASRIAPLLRAPYQIEWSEPTRQKPTSSMRWRPRQPQT
jgi:Cu/Ag efflux pump CusA